MELIENVIKYGSVCFVGMEKNVGKTETLNFVLQNLPAHLKIAVVSIGIDGEDRDLLFENKKPNIILSQNTAFVTAEKLYGKRKLVSNILYMSKRETSLGRLVIAKSLSVGKVILSGPTTTAWLKEVIDRLSQDSDLCLIDGALSRLSLASPVISDAMVLSTGAALSLTVEKIVNETVFKIDLINLPQYDTVFDFSDLNGLFAVEKEYIIDLGIPSLLLINRHRAKITGYKTLYISGILTETFLKYLLSQSNVEQMVLIVQDFSKIFSSVATTRLFFLRGGRIEVLYKANLIAITVNPLSPTGYMLNSAEIIDKLRQKTAIPVYNIKEK